MRNKFSWNKPLYFLSIIRHFYYKPNKVYTTQLGEFIPNKIVKIYTSWRGFYSYEKRTFYSNVKCIIPKGANYYRAFDLHENCIIYTSNKIKIVGLIE